MRKKGMKKAAAVIVATMVFSLFSEAGMAPQIVQAATYQKTIKNKSVKKPEVLVRADEVKVFSIKVKEVDKQIQKYTAGRRDNRNNGNNGNNRDSRRKQQCGVNRKYAGNRTTKTGNRKHYLSVQGIVECKK